MLVFRGKQEDEELKCAALRNVQLKLHLRRRKTLEMLNLIRMVSIH